MLGASYGPVSDIELVWSLIACVGIVFDVFNVREARKDLKAAQLLNGRVPTRIVLAKNHIFGSGLRLFILSLTLMVGILAMTLEDPPSRVDLPLRVTLASALIRWTFILIIVSIVLKAFIEFREREQLRLLDKEES